MSRKFFVIILCCLVSAFCFWSSTFAATVTYTIQTGNFSSTQGSGGGFHGVFDQSGTEIGMYANSAGDSSEAAFQTFTINGVGSGTARAMQVGDVFQITFFSANNPFTRLGLALRSSTDYSSFSQIDTSNELKLQLDSSGGVKVFGSTYPSGSDTGLGTGADETLTITITSANTFNVTVARNGGGTTTLYDVQMYNGNPITSFGLFLVNDNGNSYWKNGSLSDTGVAELGAGNGTSTISGLISDGLAANSTSTPTANKVVKSGTGVITLSTADTYTGETDIDNGTLKIGTGGDITASSKIYLGNGANANNAAFELGAVGADIDRPIQVNTSTGSGTRQINVTAASGTAVLGGDIDLSRALTINANSGGALNVNGGINLSFTGNNDLTVVNSSAVALNGIVSGGGSVLKQGGGVLTLSAANNYTGSTYIDDGTLKIGSGGDLTATTLINLGSSVNVFSSVLDLGATIDIGDRTIQVNESSGAGTRTINVSAGSGQSSIGQVNLRRDLTVQATAGGSLTIAGVNLSTSGNNDLTVNAASSSPVTISGAISAATGASDLNKTGSGVLTLSGNNSGSNYKLNINQGTVVLNNANALGNTAGYVGKVNFASNTGTLQASQNIATGAGVTMDVASGIVGVFNVDNTRTFTLNGSITGSGGVKKEGTGTMVISAGNVSSYSGATVVNSGTFVLNGNIASSSGVQVNSGATLQGSGTMGALSGGGFVSPGNSPGIQTATQFDPTGGMDFGFEFTSVGDPDWSQATASINDVERLTDGTSPFTANLTAANALNIYFDVASLSAGDSFRGGFYTDKNGDFTLNVSGASYTFYALNAGGPFTFNGVNYSLLSSLYPTLSVTKAVTQVLSANFSGGTVNNGWVQQFDLINAPLSAVPEPSMVVLFFTGAATIYFRRQRSKKA